MRILASHPVVILAASCARLGSFTPLGGDIPQRTDVRILMGECVRAFREAAISDRSTPHISQMTGSGLDDKLRSHLPAEPPPAQTAARFVLAIRGWHVNENVL